MLNDSVKDEIQSAYRQLLQNKSLKPRYGQRLMIADIARVLGGIETNAEGERISEQHVCVVEAGTGTGKTIAYALASIPLAQALEKKLIVSTATVALQEQIVYKDLPDILRHSGLQFSFALAKGRSRYLCLAKLDQFLAAQDGFNFNLALYPDEQLSVAGDALQLYQSLLDLLARGEWDGDRDNLALHIDDRDWQPLTSDRNQCTGRNCPHIAQCSFYRARESLGKVDCIVANHDLVLSDLALGGGAILFDPAETIYIIDEAHHLPEKTLSHFSQRARVDASRRWLDSLQKSLQSMQVQLGECDVCARQIAKLDALCEELSPLYPRVYAVISMIDGLHEEGAVYRFAGGVVPEALRELGDEFGALYSRLGAALEVIVKELDQALEDHHAIERELAESWYPALGLLYSRAQAYGALWARYAEVEVKADMPAARWIRHVETANGEDYEFNASPILAADDLQATLWSRCFAAVNTSATLTALGSFERFMMRSGVPDNSLFDAVPSPFNYASAELYVPNIGAEPSAVEAHTDAVVEYIDTELGETLGTLVLFSSWRQMNDVYQALTASVCGDVLKQGDLGKQEMLKRHCEKVDAGERSILFGLASFAEGVDLPGAYCEHVIIAKLPFAVPDDPVESALAEWIEARGGNAFMEISVPDAALRLLQACGRLLRTENDAGRISLLDRRVVSKRYGQAILNSLPPFSRNIPR